MKKIALFFLFFLCVKSALLLADESPFFYVVIPSYNNEHYCLNNLQSIARQNYPHWKAVYINDASTDQTGSIIQKYVEENGLQKKIKVIHNNKRKGMLANIYNAVKKAKPHWVVATVDGDDTLCGSDAFDHLASIYKKKPNVWMTYGSWQSDPPNTRPCNCDSFPSRVLKKRKFRSHKYISSQLRTFYAALFQNIKKKDFQHKGQFFMAAGDVAFMMPLLEMCSKGHIHYVKKVIYNYNVANPINDFKRNLQLQAQCASIIRKKKPYKPVKTAFWRNSL